MITIGPVIGLVTPRSARVLFETSVDLDDFQVSLTPVVDELVHHARRPISPGFFDGCFSSLFGGSTQQGDDECKPLVNQDNALSIHKTMNVKANRAHAVQFDLLMPGTHYRFSFSDPRLSLDGVPDSVFQTPSDNDHHRRLAIVSCNYLERMGKKDLWKDLADRVCCHDQDKSIELIVHGGDQIYSDDGHQAWPNCLKRIEERGLSNINQDDMDYMAEQYRNMYRSTWAYKHQRRAMANASNIAIGDDHDYFDDAGSLEPHWDPFTKEHLIARVARQVYWEYQRQLIQDIPFDDEAKMQSEFWSKSEGYSLSLHPRVGLLMLDLRAGRMFDRSAEEPFLGKSQWQDIEQSFAEQFEDKDVLLMVSPVPFVFLGTNTCDMLLRISDYLNDLMDQWAFKEHLNEQRRMLNLLKQWKEAKPGREIAIVAGDAHFGFCSNVIDNEGRLFCKQFTSSGITNAPPPYLATAAINLLSKVEDRVNENYKFAHTSWVTTQNYGVISLNRLDCQVPVVSLEHIF